MLSARHPLGQDLPPKLIVTDQPTEAVWFALKHLQSARVASYALDRKIRAMGVDIDSDKLEERANSLAFCLRNASDYFQGSAHSNISQRVLNLYYGMMSFASAEIVSHPDGPAELGKIEERTRFGHGLEFFDGGGGANFYQTAVILKTNGFFPFWMRLHYRDLARVGVEKKTKDVAELKSYGPHAWASMENLLFRIPELLDLLLPVSNRKPGWIRVGLDSARSFDRPVNIMDEIGESYLNLSDATGKLTVTDLKFFFPAMTSVELNKEKSEKEGRGKVFSALYMHDHGRNWYDSLNLHNSPFIRNALIFPIFRHINDFRAICFTLLYALSIIVRYRPSLWRRVTEGDLTHLRVLIESFLTVVERVMPAAFLEQIGGEKIVLQAPGSVMS